MFKLLKSNGGILNKCGAMEGSTDSRSKPLIVTESGSSPDLKKSLSMEERRHRRAISATTDRAIGLSIVTERMQKWRLKKI